MSVKITKQKSKTTSKVANPVAEKVEELAKLRKQVDEMKSIERSYDALRKELLSMVPFDWDPTEPFILEGTEHKVVFAPARSVRQVINLPALHKALGDDTFYAIVKVNVTDLDKYLTEAESAAFVASAQSGIRLCNVREL